MHFSSAILSPADRTLPQIAAFDSAVRKTERGEELGAVGFIVVAERYMLNIAKAKTLAVVRKEMLANVQRETSCC